MAYFSNGTEGMAYEEQYCHRCVNWRDIYGITNSPGCPIIDLHFEYNYDQIGKTKLAKAIKDVLDELIPTPKDQLFPGECSMFIEKQFEHDPEKTYLKELQNGKAPVFGVKV